MYFRESDTPLDVLIADDSSAIRMLLTHTLEKWGFHVTVCSNGNEVWQQVKKGTHFHIYILDWVMPGLSGLELCQKIRQMQGNEYSYIMLLTSNSTTNDIVEGLSSGADDYLIKPVAIQELKARIKVGQRLFNYQAELQRRESNVLVSCYKALTELAEARDYETGTHIARIAGLSRALSEAAGLPSDFCKDVETFSPMHDIGKVGIPDGILHLPRRLNADEFAIMKTHAQIGYEILKDKKTLELAAEIAWSHHEKWDGSGYPCNLKGENIPLSGRVVSIADVYDALRSVRPYKTSFSHEDSIEWIIGQSGKSFDPDLIDAFKKCHKELEHIFDSQYNPEFAQSLLSQGSRD